MDERSQLGGRQAGAGLAVQCRCPAGEDTTIHLSVSREQRRLHHGCREAVGCGACDLSMGEEKQSSNVIGFNKAGWKKTSGSNRLQSKFSLKQGQAPKTPP